jgi:hypothetical protein
VLRFVIVSLALREERQNIRIAQLNKATCDQPHGKYPFLRRKLVYEFAYFVEPKGSAKYLKEPATGFYPAPDEISIVQSHIPFL